MEPLIIRVEDHALDVASLLRELERGRDVLFSRDGCVVARLLPAAAGPRGGFGRLHGLIEIADDFDAPLELVETSS